MDQNIQTGNNNLSGQLGRFLLAGVTAAVFQLATYILFTRALEWWYLLASTVSFVLTVIVSFLLQKFFTFRHRELSSVSRQFGFFGVLSLCNLGLNTLYMFLFVDILQLPDFYAQVLAIGLIAVSSFFLYRQFIFK